MAGEIKKVQFSEGLNVDTPADIPFTADDFTGIMPTAKGGTGVNGSAVFPTSGTVATTADITAAFEGKKFKDPVVVATTTNITLSGEQTIDGVLTSASRVLVKNQSAPAENGIYVSAAGVWARASDANTWDELTSAIVAVEMGTSNSDTGWFCIANSGGTLGTTAIVWEQKFGTGSVDLTSDVTGILPIPNGGTGESNAADAYNALSPASSKGDIVSHNGTGAEVLAVGANGKVLGANSAEASGLEWIDAATLPIDLTSDVSGTLPIANGGTDATTANDALANISGMTAKGDLITRDAGSPAVLGVGVDGQVLTADSTQTLGLKWSDVGGGGSGEINVVENPSAASATTGWTAGTSHTNTRDTSNSPLASVISTCFAMTSSAAVSLGSQTNTSGIYDSITMPSGLRSKKLKFEFYMTTPAASDGTWAIAVYEGSTRLALSTDSSGDTILPSGVTGKFTTYFDTSTASGYSVHFVQRTRTNANTLYVTNVIVGPGIQPQGAVVGPVTSWTPALTASTTNPVLGSGSNFAQEGRYYRDGEVLVGQVLLRFGNSGSPSAGSGTYRIGLPSGLTVNSSALARNTETDVAVVGSGTIRDDSVPSSQDVNVIASSAAINYVTLVTEGNATVTNSAPFTWAASDFISITFRVPIAEWAGSGTVNLASGDSMGMPLVYKYTQWNPSATSDVYTDPTAGTTQSSNSDISVGTISSGTQTFTFNRQGKYLVLLSTAHSHAQTYSLYHFETTLGGTASRFGGIDDPYLSQGESSIDGNEAQTYSIVVDVTAIGQTLTVRPRLRSSGLGGTTANHTANCGIIIQPLSAIGQAVGFGAATDTSMGLISRESSGSFTANFTGPFSQSVTVYYRRFGKMVMLDIPEVSGTSTVATYLSASAAIPTGIKPGKTYYLPIFVRNNGSDLATPGYMVLNNLGDISIRKSFTDDNFASTGIAAGPRGGYTVCYYLA